MKDFISLQKFLMLTEPGFPNESLGHLNRGFVCSRGHDIGLEILARYEIAKASFKAYGDAGPPIGSNVITLVAGHNGSEGVTRKFLGPDSVHGDRHFVLECEPSRWSTRPQLSLVVRSVWWALIVPVDLVTQTRGHYVELKKPAQDLVSFSEVAV